MNLRSIHQIATKQHGVIGRQQLSGIGVSPKQLQTLKKKGHLIAHQGNTFLLPGSSNSLLQRITTATLADTGRGIASHRTAAFLWDCWNLAEADEIDIIVSGRSHSAATPGMTSHSPRDMHNLSPIRRLAIRTTIPSRTIIDFAAVAPYALQSMTERMLFAGHISRDRLIAAVAQHSRHGRTGIGAVRKLLAEWPYTDDVAESVLELRMQSLLVGTPFSDFVTQLEIGSYRVDFAWLSWKIVLECDGWGKVDSSAYFARAARRDSFLQSKGWLVLHFTWAEITRRPGLVLAEIRRAFITRGWLG